MTSRRAAEAGRGPRAASRRGRFPDPGTAAAVAAMELRRSGRAFRAHDYALVGTVIFGVPVALALAVTFEVARTAGEALAAGEPAASFGRTLFVGGFLFLVAMHAVTGLGRYGSIDNEAGMLTLRPAKDVAGGLVLTWTVTYSLYLLLPVLAGFAGLAVGVGSPTPPVGALAATAVAAALAGAVGFPLGLAVKGLRRRHGRLERVLPAVGVVVFLVYMWVMFTGRWVAALERIEPVVDGPPLGWLADLAFVTTPGADASVAGAVAGVAVAVVVVPAGTLATVRAAEYAWYADPAEPSEREGSAPTAGVARYGSRLLAALSRRHGTHGVAAVVLTRGVRRPMQLLYGLFPLLVGIPMLESLWTDGSFPWYAPWLVILLGAWLAGETFPLNLLGNQGATLPSLLTSRADGRTLVHGHVLAVAVPLVPVTTSLAVAAGVLAGRPPVELVGIALAAPLGVVAAAVLAAGFGALFPRFDTLTVGGAVEVAVPSKRALGAFSLSISLGTLGATLAADETAREVTALLLSEFVPLVEPAPGTLEPLGWLLVVALVAGVGLAYRVAVRRVDGFRIS